MGRELMVTALVFETTWELFIRSESEKLATAWELLIELGKELMNCGELMFVKESATGWELSILGAGDV